MVSQLAAVLAYRHFAFLRCKLNIDPAPVAPESMRRMCVCVCVSQLGWGELMRVIVPQPWPEKARQRKETKTQNVSAAPRCSKASCSTCQLPSHCDPNNSPREHWGVGLYPLGYVWRLTCSLSGSGYRMACTIWHHPPRRRPQQTARSLLNLHRRYPREARMPKGT